MIDRSCPACGSDELIEIYRLEHIPVQSCILLQSREEALSLDRALLVLEFCEGCGFIFNSAFDESLLDYASATEESQHFSGTFNSFAGALVDELASSYDLEGRLTIEIGCGKGDFLRELARRTGTRGLGIDPGFLPERFQKTNGPELHFVREHFDPENVEVAPDLVLCRHTLEHIRNVRHFVADIRRLAGKRDNVGIFFETPDVERVLTEGAFWDIYYEHCSYFTLGSHARLFRQEGMEVTRSYLGYNDQYIIQYARLGRSGSIPLEQDLARLRDLARSFPARVAARRDYWTEFVRSRHAADRRVAIWGGGSKAVSFLTTDGLQNEVAQVIDINPYKQGKYLPGTGHQLIRPIDLQHEPPDTIIVMNPIYVQEVGAALESLGLDSEVVAL